MIESILNSFDIWTSAQGIKSKGRVKSIDNINLEGIVRLRKFILELAIRGKLVPQNKNEETGSELVKRIKKEKQKLVNEGELKKENDLSEVKDEEKPYTIPENWSWTRLGNIGVGSTGKTPNTSISKYFGGDIPFIGPGNITSEGNITQSDKTLTDSGAENSTVADVKDIIMVCIGGSIGKSAIVNFKICFNQQLNCIRPILFDTSYLYNALNAPYFHEFIIKKSSGSATPIINRGKWEEIPIPVPPIEEQKRIVNKVNELMTFCDLLEEQQTANLRTHHYLVKSLLDTLTNAVNGDEHQTAWGKLSEHFDTLFCTEDSIEQLKQTILQLAIMGKLVKQDQNDIPANELLIDIHREKDLLIGRGEKIRNSISQAIINKNIKFGIPSNWCWCRLQDIVSILGDGIHGTPNYDDSGDCYFVNGNNLNNGIIEIKPDTKTVSEAEFQKHKRDLNERTVLVSINGTIGKTAFYNNEKIILGKSACYFNLMNGINKDYIRLLLNTRYFLDYAFSEATGTTIKNVSLKTMRSFIIPLPPSKEQIKIIEAVSNLFNICNELLKKISKSEEIKILLSKKIFEFN